MRSAADESVLHKFDDGGVIHGGVGNIVPPGERGDDHVGHTETKLRRKSLNGGRVAAVGSRIVRSKIAVYRSDAADRQAWIVGVGIDGDLRDVGDGSQCGGCVVV